MKHYHKAGLVNVEPLLTKEGTYKHYRKWRDANPSRYNITNNEAMKKLIRAIFKKIAISMHESPGGVVLKNFGYMYVFRSPNKVSFEQKWDGDIFVNHKKKGRLIRPVFMASKRPQSKFKTWSMDLTFSQYVQHRTNRKVYDGGVFKAYPYTVKMLNLL